MAQIILSGDELICILKAHALIPEQVIGVEMAAEQIKVKVRTPWPVLKSIRVSVRFAGFEAGHVVIELVTNRLVDAFDWLVDRMLASLQLEDHGARWEYPRLYVDVNKLLPPPFRGVEITGVVFEEDRFHITTAHFASAGRSGDVPADPGPERSSGASQEA
jgi:hypothetical protein